jgi:prolyl-tRNA synthetase
MISVFAGVYEDLLGVPVIKGRKSEGEKFAGAQKSLTLETMIPGSGRALQAATSHYLGQKFARIFDITCKDNGREPVWQSCWGLSIRALGATILTHGDDEGLVLPPRISPYQVVIVPVISVNPEAANKVMQLCSHVSSLMKTTGTRVHIDAGPNDGVGHKLHHWEVRGVPLAIVIGDAEAAACESHLFCIISNNIQLKAIMEVFALSTSSDSP